MKACLIEQYQRLWVSCIRSSFGLTPLPTATYLGERKIGTNAAKTVDVLGLLFCERPITFAKAV